MPQDLNFSDNFFGVVDISKYVIYKFYSNNFPCVKMLSFDDLSKTSFS